MASAAGNPKRDFQFFVEIIDAFKTAGESSESGKPTDMKIEPFLHAMKMFLRIFDAFSNPFFSDVVKKDVDGNIKKLGAAAERYSATTISEVLDAETNESKLLKQIKTETGQGGTTGTVALLWMKRTMQFVIGLLKILVDDLSASLSSASRKSYSVTLRYCHNLITRGVFDTGLRFAPSRESFYKNLGGDTKQVDGGLKEYLLVAKPLLDGIVDDYKARGLERYIK